MHSKKDHFLLRVCTIGLVVATSKNVGLVVACCAEWEHVGMDIEAFIGIDARAIALDKSLDKESNEFRTS